MLKQCFTNEKLYKGGFAVILMDVDILEELFDRKILSVLKLFINRQDMKFYLREISKETKIPPATVYRILNKLVALEILTREETKNSKLYVLSDSRKAAFLRELLKLEKNAVGHFVDSVKDMPGLEEVILVGKEESSRANLIMIGEGLDAAHIKKICSDIKEKTDYTVTTFSLNREQYGQMLTMGLYPGTKKVLLRR